MRHRILFWRLLATYLIVVLTALVTMGWYSAHALRAFETRDTTATLDSHTALAKTALAPLIQSNSFAEADALCKRIGRESGTRITLIRPDGVVAGDSFEQVERMENHGDRPELRAAIRGGRGTDSRLSRTLGERLTYQAIPFEYDDRVVAVVRASLPLAPIERDTWQLYSQLAAGLIIGITMAAAAAWFTSNSIAGPMFAMQDGVRRIAGGDFHRRVPVPATREMARFGAALNAFAGKLDAHITESNRHRNEGEAILSSMIEGVLAVDTQSRVISMNGAAGSMLGISAGLAAGLPVEEAAPNREVQRFVNETLTHSKPIEAEFTLRAQGGDVVHAQGTPLRDGEGKRIGAVVVLHDVTRLRRLEQVRRDFVANVSHELKTPITAIKGYVETILDRQLHDAGQAKRSMRTVAKHAGRLNAIIEDLLALSRIEQDEGTGDQRFEVHQLRGVLERAIQHSAVRAADRDIELALHCDSKLSVRMNAAMLEKAVLNLIENAIQYSDDGGRVGINVENLADSVQIHVIDYGCGIAAEHLPRLFDRFYRVNSAASAQVAGTGLGLAIVQHIARAHEGTVRVTSTPGEGSTFTLELPAG